MNRFRSAHNQPEPPSGLDISSFMSKLMEESALITVKEAAALLSCSTRKVHNLIKYGEISGYGENVGKKGIRVLASELRDYAKSSMFNAKNRKQQGTTTQKTMTE